MEPTPTPQTHRVFLVDEHPMTRKGYACVLSAEPDLAVCGEAGTADEAVARVPAAAPDLVVAGLAFEAGPGGLDLVRHLLALAPGLRILVVSMQDERLYAERVLRAGARGYLPKTAPREALVQAVRRVLAGHLSVSEEVQTRMILGLARGGVRPGADAIGGLTDRELEVFEHLGRGRSTREIAAALRISPKTVESYRLRIRERLGLGSTGELVRRAVQWVEGGRAAPPGRPAPPARAVQPCA